MKKVAVIVAGGSGQRMGNSTPKQFLLLAGKPLLVHTIHAFISAFEAMQIILVLPEAFIGVGNEIVKTYFPQVAIQLVSGGETRFHSVQKGLSLVKEESVVFVHDGVRCLLSADLIRRCYTVALSNGSAIPVIASKDSVRLQAEHGHKAYDRNRVMLVQTPQTFISSWILPAFNTEYKQEFTDEATVVEMTGKSLTLTEGEETNIKITKPVDLLIAEQWLSTKENVSGQ